MLALAAFIALATHHHRLGRARRRTATLHDLNADALARLARDWENLPLRHTRRAPAEHPYAADLDLFGPASVLHLLDTTSTSFGQETLASWLLAPADLATVRARQSAVAELGPALDFRQELTARGRLRDEPAADPEPFLAWAEAERWLAARPWFLTLGYLWPLAFWGAFAGALLGFWPNRVWIAVFILNVGLGQFIAGAAHEVIERAISSGRAIQSYAAMLAWLTANPFTSPALRDLQSRLTVSSPPSRRPADLPSRPAASQLRRLARLTSWAITRDSPLYFPLQALTGWDIHHLAALERWQAESGAQVRIWLHTLGEMEALVALAGLVHDEPTWVYPEIDPDLDSYLAAGLGHPLLADAVRVTNDVTVGPPGSFLLVTGSNMSGKSTLLRAIGVNAVLAAAGGPACARSLRLPPLRLWTSVRVEDSLARGVSYFMAELLRLKQVVDAADATAPVDRRLLYLLDEILQGTNTTERRIAARRIISHLVATGAVGAVSTHDLDLATDSPLADAARPIHFREQVADGTLSFDYLARPGLATSTNALKLMDLVGLPTE